MKKISAHKLTSDNFKTLSNDRGVLRNFPIGKYMQMPYPNEVQSQEEILYINSLPTNENIKFILRADKSVKYFEQELNKIGLNWKLKDDKQLKKLIKNLSPYIILLKHHYNRPRPNEMSDVKYIWLESAQTPAYPSGHSTIARFVALYLADKYPNKKTEIIKIGDNVGISRLLARVHYPSDHYLGKKLATDLYTHYKKYAPINQ